MHANDIVDICTPARQPKGCPANGTSCTMKATTAVMAPAGQPAARHWSQHATWPSVNGAWHACRQSLSRPALLPLQRRQSYCMVVVRASSCKRAQEAQQTPSMCSISVFRLPMIKSHARPECNACGRDRRIGWMTSTERAVKLSQPLMYSHTGSLHLMRRRAIYQSLCVTLRRDLRPTTASQRPVNADIP
jgi:hypothetical protein